MSFYEPDSRGTCPHCRHAATFDEPPTNRMVGQRMERINTALSAHGDKEYVHVYSSVCPNCLKPIVVMTVREETTNKVLDRRLIFPPNVVRAVPPEVPPHIGEDFAEAAAVISLSEKASAALSRRCLQSVLNEKIGKRKDLSTQIDEAIKQLPTRIGENLDCIRQVGNYAAHPEKVESTGTIVDVEPEEANWTLDVLEELFDHYYVMPKKAEERRAKLDKKLKSIGKPAMKKP